MIYQRHDFEILPISSLEKVLGQQRPCLFESENSALAGERVGFQIAYRSVGTTRTDLRYSLKGVSDESVRVYAVKDVPCSYPAAENSDDYLLKDKPCLMPDVLASVPASGLTAKAGLWQSLYIVVFGLEAGTYRMTISLYDGEIVLGETDYTLHVLTQRLPQVDLLFSYWIHYDCIADWYGVPLFSEEYNKFLGSFLISAVEHGLTMLLTPIFTPPLDTEVGKERMTVQLVDVVKDNGCYSFCFERLGRFMRFAEGCGVRYFEMSHLFSQWGAKCAPKIVARVNGELIRIFGWDTEALSDDYKAFLAAFLPSLRNWLMENGYYTRCYFHISDEPDDGTVRHYTACHDFVKLLLPDAKFIDAMSNFAYYEQKAVDHPFVALDVASEFAEKGAEDYFLYYCTNQKDRFVSNRFLSMPLERTRILGMQMYLNHVRGFLQWGYNYYYSALSREMIDPFFVTDGGGKFQSGDPFIVYPGENGALDSLRNEVFLHGVQDLRALYLLENLIGREKVCALLLGSGLQKNFTDYPKNALWLIGLRKKINRMIEIS